MKPAFTSKSWKLMKNSSILTNSCRPKGHPRRKIAKNSAKYGINSGFHEFNEFGFFSRTRIGVGLCSSAWAMNVVHSMQCSAWGALLSAWTLHPWGLVLEHWVVGQHPRCTALGCAALHCKPCTPGGGAQPTTRLCIAVQSLDPHPFGGCGSAS